MNDSNHNIAFIGGGNMASSIIGGLLYSGWPRGAIFVSDSSKTQRKQLESQFSITCFEDNSDCIKSAETVVLAVKPQVMSDAISSIKDLLVHRKPLLLSIAAGIRIATINKWIGEELPVIRVMPNTPALVNQGVSGLLANALANENHKFSAEQIMSAVGPVVWVSSESDIDTVTAVSGSGPAYFFKLMEIMIKVAKENGLSTESAKTLVLQTATGAAKLAQESENMPVELRQQVASPGGTTEAALLSMEADGIDEIISKAIQAAIEKSDELANMLGGD